MVSRPVHNLRRGVATSHIYSPILAYGPVSNLRRGVATSFFYSPYPSWVLSTTSCQCQMFSFLFSQCASFFVIWMSQNSVFRTECHYNHPLWYCLISSKNIESVGKDPECGQESFHSHCLPAFIYTVEALSSLLHFSQSCVSCIISTFSAHPSSRASGTHFQLGKCREMFMICTRVCLWLLATILPWFPGLHAIIISTHNILSVFYTVRLSPACSFLFLVICFPCSILIFSVPLDPSIHTTGPNPGPIKYISGTFVADSNWPKSHQFFILLPLSDPTIGLCLFLVVIC